MTIRVGAAGFAILEYGTRTLHGFSEIIIGSILLVVVLVFPGGILGGLLAMRRRFGLAARPIIIRRIGSAPGDSPYLKAYMHSFEMERITSEEEAESTKSVIRRDEATTNNP